MAVISMGQHYAGGHMVVKSDLNGLKGGAVVTLHWVEGLLGGVAGALIAIGVWVASSVATGFLNVFMTLAVGSMVGMAENICGRKGLHSYRGMAVILALLGSVAGNVLAGLSVYSAKMGVDYWQVLMARRLPEDLGMLGTALVQSFEPDHVFFYAVAIYLAYRLAGVNLHKT